MNTSKVGINEPSPDEALHVIGNVKVIGTVKIEDVLWLVPRNTEPVPPSSTNQGMIYLDISDAENPKIKVCTWDPTLTPANWGWRALAFEE